VHSFNLSVFGNFSRRSLSLPFGARRLVEPPPGETSGPLNQTGIGGQASGCGSKHPRKKRATPALDPAQSVYWRDVLRPALFARHGAFLGQVQAEDRQGKRGRKGTAAVVASHRLAKDLGVSYQMVQRALGLRSKNVPDALEPFIPGPTLFTRLRTAILARQDTAFRAQSGKSRLARVDDTQLTEWQGQGLPSLRFLCEEREITQRALAKYLGVSEMTLKILTRKKKPGRPVQGVFDKGQELARKLAAPDGLPRVLREIQESAMGGVAVANRGSGVASVRRYLGEVPLTAMPKKPEFQAFLGDPARKKWSKPRRLYAFFSNWLTRDPNAVGVMPSIPALQQLWVTPTENVHGAKRDPLHVSRRELQTALTWLAYEGKVLNRDAKVGFVRPGLQTPEVVKTFREKTFGEQAIERLRDWIAVQRLVEPSKSFVVSGMELAALEKSLSVPKQHLRTALLYWHAQGQVRVTRKSAQSPNCYDVNPSGAKPILREKKLQEGLLERVDGYATTPMESPRGLPALISDALYPQVVTAHGTSSPFKTTVPEVSRAYVVTPSTAREALMLTLDQLERPDSPLKGRYRVKREEKGFRGKRPSLILEFIPWSERPRALEQASFCE
jgi:hypothetical protein